MMQPLGNITQPQTRTRRSSRRSGFSFMEILLVMSIITVLVALLLPAVQAAREAVRRTACSRHLTQMMLGVQQYEMSHECYPAGVTHNKRPIIEAPVGYHHSWVVRTLPHIQQRNTFNHVDFQQSVYHPANSPVRQLGFEVMHCPSDGAPFGGRSNYAGIHHDREAPIDISNNGVFILNHPIKARDVSDGLSYTMFIGEKIIDRRDLGWMSGTRSTLRNAGSINGFTARLGAPTWEDEIQNQIYSLADADKLKKSQRSKTVGGISSRHPGGAMVVHGDGSCRFVAETVDIRAFRMRACRHDEPVSIDWIPSDDW